MPSRKIARPGPEFCSEFFRNFRPDFFKTCWKKNARPTFSYNILDATRNYTSPPRTFSNTQRPNKRLPDGKATSPNRPAPFPLRVGFLRLPAGWVSFSKIIAQRRVPVPRKASGGPAGLTSKSQKIREQRFSQSFSVGSSLLRRRVTTRGQWVPRGHPAFWLVWFVSAHSFQTHLPTAT